MRRPLLCGRPPALHPLRPPLASPPLASPPLPCPRRRSPSRLPQENALLRDEVARLQAQMGHMLEALTLERQRNTALGSIL